MTMPDYIKITHQPKTMDTPAALTSDDTPPAPLSEDDLRRGWNQQADEHNQWESLDSAEQLAWAQARAIAADRALSQPSSETSATGALTDIQLWELLPKRLEQNLLAMVQLAAPHYKLKPIDLLQDIAPDFVDYARAALKAEPRRKGPTDEDLYDLAAEFNGDPVPAMRRALELWGNPLQGAPAPGETPATPPAPVPGDVARPTYLDAIRLAQGCHDYSGGHTGAEGEAWHGAIDTVVDVLKRAAVGPWDSQTRAVFGVGAEAQAVPVPVAWCRSDEFANSINRGGSFNGWMDPGAGANKCDMQLYAIPLPAPVPVTECPNCGYEGEMVPVTQAGKVKA
jgi:hypothetical protein